MFALALAFGPKPSLAADLFFPLQILMLYGSTFFMAIHTLSKKPYCERSLNRAEAGS
jgi:hypothetical protein